MDPAAVDQAAIDRIWEDDVVPCLVDYTRIPCLSPAFDPQWEPAGHLHQAARLLAAWCAGRRVPGLTAEVVAPAGRTPVVVVDVPGTMAGTVLLYGHLDKQPPQGAWREGLGPFTPVRDGDRLYGRGTADDGYSVFAAVTALEALAEAGRPHARAVVLIEASEESGSPDLDFHLSALGDRVGRPDLVLCLDSGCLTYDRLWTTSSLRGNLVATVRVDVLTEGVHSGLGGGVVPSSFRILRRLLSRVEDERDGRILLPELQAAVPERHREQLESVAAELGPGRLPTVPGLQTAPQPLLAAAWAPALALTGIDGIPAASEGGNVLRPFTAARISLRLPPTVDAERAAHALVKALTENPPEGATVSVDLGPPAGGWVAPEPAPHVADALRRASVTCFGREPSSYGEGGTIPFLATLAARFPGIQLVATGVLGPESNAHGPNEFLHLPMAKAVTLAAAELLAARPG